ncbi:MAG TPA: NADAR family protein [Polyangiaceae bacterium]|nr:NADAR family protein [Polyangiaceae bacterium]
MLWLDESGIPYGSPALVYRTKEEYGCLSNMAAGFELVVGSFRVASSEALYQALRYPDQPDWQREILAAPTPRRAKMAAKKAGRRFHSRPDWNELQVPVMRWVLALKLRQHPLALGTLMSTGARPIVERSRRDDFWGAVLDGPEVLRSTNQLGRQLMTLRDGVALGYSLLELAALPAPGSMRLCDHLLSTVSSWA